MSNTPRAVVLVALMGGLAMTAAGARAQDPAPTLEQGFARPPDSAKPRTWWHWTGGNVTESGITKDLEWMQRVGIGGAELADVGFGRGQTVPEKIEFGTPAWLDAVRHAAVEAQRLGLEFGIFSSPGWSETGGPWVQPAQAMKKLVWSRTVVEGPRQFSGPLAAPPSNNGPFQDLRIGGPRGGAAPDPTFYGDSAVIAFRTPAAEGTSPVPTVTASNGPIDAAALLDDDWNSAVTIPAPADGSPAWVQLAYTEPFTARAITLAGRGGIPVGRVLAGDDGEHFRTLVELPGEQLYRQGSVRTFAFPATRAKYFRVEMTGAPLGPAATMSQARPEPAKQYVLTALHLHAGARVNRWEEKAVFSFLFEYETVPTPAVPADAAIRPADVVDLTSRLAADGTLNWDVPPGRWTILRLGYSLTGSKNKPPVPSGSGYEADKLNRADMEAYYHGYFDPIAGALGPLFGGSLKYVTMDSWEAGMDNWTDNLLAEFRRRRGYDPTPYLPVLTGRVVESADVSDRFLWDFRRTLADLWADNHYGVMTELLHQHGLQTYGEAAGVSLEIPEDTLLNKSKVDIPMGEFWVHDLHPHLMYYQDVRGAASAAHVYGKPLVAAEAFTGGGYESPFTLKTVSDYWLTQGVNRLVFHTSAEQPLDTKPGNTMVGTHLNRNITWAEEAGPFMSYLAREQFLLQQGRPVADLAYLLDEGAPSTMPIWGAGLVPPPPRGYDYDYINADVLLHRLAAGDDGRLMLPDGASYRLLVLPSINRMRPELLRRLHELVAAGATIVGPRPVGSPSLMGWPDADREVHALAADLWGDLDGVSRTIHYFGKGRVVWGLPLPDVLASLGVSRDFESNHGLDADIAWVHRRDGDTDLYYVVNHTDHPADLTARFRVGGREAELWHADTGRIEPAGYALEGDRTVVPLHFDPRESVFVVFRQKAPAPARTVPPARLDTVGAIDGPWRVSFPPDFGAPAQVEFPQLASWTDNSDDGVKYFSGTATYTRTVQAPESWFHPGARLLLDLGEVRDLAAVTINGHALGVLWKPPYRVDVSGILRPGENQFEIRVTNEWTNRLIGDRALPLEKKVLSGGLQPGGIGAPVTAPLPSGLLGPVTVRSGPPD